jgi:hypothetical protein
MQVRTVAASFRGAHAVHPLLFEKNYFEIDHQVLG